MATDARKHDAPAAGETPTRTKLDALSLTINDVIPAANATEQAQIASAMSAAGYGASSTSPLVTLRQDAEGLHKIEYSEDGSVWLPSSGVLHFANDTARDSWTTSNSSYLSVGDRCVSNSLMGYWDGSAWVQNAAPASGLVTFDTNWSDYSTQPIRVAVWNGVVHIDGIALCSTSWSGTTGLFTLNDSSLFPKSGRWHGMSEGTSGPGRCDINTSGDVTSYDVSGSASATLAIRLVYPLI